MVLLQPLRASVLALALEIRVPGESGGHVRSRFDECLLSVTLLLGCGTRGDAAAASSSRYHRPAPAAIARHPARHRRRTLVRPLPRPSLPTFPESFPVSSHSSHFSGCDTGADWEGCRVPLNGPGVGFGSTTPPRALSMRTAHPARTPTAFATRSPSPRDECKQPPRQAVTPSTFSFPPLLPAPATRQVPLRLRRRGALHRPHRVAWPGRRCSPRHRQAF